MEAIRINKIANCPDDALELYEGSPIYENLLRRRILAREISKTLLNKESLALFNMFEDEIKNFLSL